MKKLKNPFIELETSIGYSCFGCAPNNHMGLKMEFYEDGDEILSTWRPDHHFEGFLNVLHGGIQATLIDEIASWVVFVKLKTGGFTSDLKIKYIKSVLIDRGSVTLRASLEEMDKNIAHIKVALYDGQGDLCSEGVASYFTLPEHIARKKMMYPGADSFYK